MKVVFRRQDGSGESIRARAGVRCSRENNEEIEIVETDLTLLKGLLKLPGWDPLRPYGDWEIGARTAIRR